MRATPHPFSTPAFEDEPERNYLPRILIGAVVVLVVIGAGWRLFYGHATSPTGTSPVVASLPESAPTAATGDRPPAAAVSPATAVPPLTAAPAPGPAAAPSRPAVAEAPPATHSGPGTTARSADTGSGAVHEEIPRVPQSARDTIHGRVKVSVRVLVDKSGNVVRDTFESPGPSNYFNRLASQAARKWKFASVNTDGKREWLLRFEFGREGTTVHATRARS